MTPNPLRTLWLGALVVIAGCTSRGGAAGAATDTGRASSGDPASADEVDGAADGAPVAVDLGGRDASDTGSGADTLPDDASSDPSQRDTDTIVCRDVDLLFVVDNSASMDDNQASLVASFPGFIDAMRARLSHADSFHVGVVSTDYPYQNGEGCTEIGDLITRTRSAACGPYTGGTRYIDGLDPDLDESFACAAGLGVLGDDNERVMRALLNAVQPARNAPGGCNAGFLRSDSLLVIVIVTDEDDAPDGTCEPGDLSCTVNGSGGRADDWVAEFETYRPGALENTVVLSLMARLPDSPCGAQQAARLVGFTLRFGARGHIGDVCEPSYDAFFEAALPLLDDACKIGS